MNFIDLPDLKPDKCPSCQSTNGLHSLIYKTWNSSLPTFKCIQCDWLVYSSKPTEIESILQEAQRLTHGDRNTTYGHPLDDYSRTAGMVNSMLAHKLKEPLTPSECAAIMCCVKLSRQAHSPKRDNMIDLAGYAWVVQECLDETERRAKNANR